MLHRPSHSVTLLLAIAASCVAADGNVHLRLSHGVMPGVSSGTIQSSTPSNDVIEADLDMTDDGGSMTSIGLETYGFGHDGRVAAGWYVGLGWGSLTGTGPTGTVTVEPIAMRLGVDLAYRPVPWAILSIGPRVDGGFASQHQDRLPSHDGSGYFYAIGAQVGAYATMGHLVLGLEGGWTSWGHGAGHDEPSFAGTTQTVVDRFGGSGSHAAVVIGCAW